MRTDAFYSQARGGGLLVERRGDTTTWPGPKQPGHIAGLQRRQLARQLRVVGAGTGTHLVPGQTR